MTTDDTTRPGPTGAPQRPADAAAQQGGRLTTAQGLRLDETEHSLKAGPRGPSLLEDHHLREKITHFDHERIPERVVHARGAGAYGTFRSYGTAASVTKARFLATEGAETEVFVRFSTVLGSRGSADTARDVRGFATKFYTDEGNFDLVGNDMPVFFIQDAIKFPDLIHAGKPEPDREIPQAQSAHDTFWDFASLHTESTHMLLWVMSDRGIPRSYRTVEGFGVHTFRLEAADGSTSLVKFHWKPVLGVHSLVWEEAQLAGGADPDFHRRDLADAITAGAYPEWELGLQVMPDTPDETFEGIDLLDPTKIVPEELCPVQPVGRMTLHTLPENYFAETEQVAFHVANLVPGIHVTNDPLMQGRLFSYLDTQITRLGGPNFAQLPVNRPHVPVDDMQRDGMHQTAVHRGVAPYQPNSLGGGCPVASGAQGYVSVPTPVEGTKVREAPASFADHYSQATLFWESMTPVEQAHVVGGFTFELGKVFEAAIVERMVGNLVRVHPDLAARVARGLGIDVPDLPAAEHGSADGVTPSPALSQVPREPGRVDGRVVGVIADDGADLAGIAALRAALDEHGVVLRVVASHGGTLRTQGAEPVTVDRALVTTRSIEYDAVVVADGAAGTPVAGDPATAVLLAEAFRHGKALAAWGDGADVLGAAVDADAPGVDLVDDVDAVVGPLLQGLGMHRSWERLAAIAGV
ncbi:catalase [Sediminihabitans luteus]|uniref:Catalase n=1 Tax=Sediminihabitans luteus TaxID=1138585 RepID=A0A2M9CC37_9CELL|nr:catalase [Sediminihabitans luteus]PJJ68615.1 catalase [Sediminihabitans luteus]GII99953.1 catalase [Sediminihabitans luteus]